jgi:hypothetical protein
LEQEVESEESDAQSDTASEQIAPPEGVNAGAIPAVSPESCRLAFILLAVSLVTLLTCLLLSGTGIALGLLSAQPLPFLHPLARLAYALLAVRVIAFLLLFPSASVLFPQGALVTFFAEMKRERPARFRRLVWKRAIGASTGLLLTGYLLIVAVAPVWLIKRWPVWSLPPVAQGLVNTAIFLGITALVVLITWLPGRLLGRPDRKSSTPPAFLGL